MFKPFKRKSAKANALFEFTQEFYSTLGLVCWLEAHGRYVDALEFANELDVPPEPFLSFTDVLYSSQAISDLMAIMPLGSPFIKIDCAELPSLDQDEDEDAYIDHLSKKQEITYFYCKGIYESYIESVFRLQELWEMAIEAGVTLSDLEVYIDANELPFEKDALNFAKQSGEFFEFQCKYIQLLDGSNIPSLGLKMVHAMNQLPEKFRQQAITKYQEQVVRRREAGQIDDENKALDMFVKKFSLRYVAKSKLSSKPKSKSQKLVS